MNPLLGMKIIEDKNMVDHFQTKKHHKKRINKKWLRRYGTTSKPKTNVFKVGDTLIMHPYVAIKLRQQYGQTL